MTLQRGFTLLELLIGLALLGFVMALLLGGFRLASGSWDAVETKVERTSGALVGRNLLRRLLTQSLPIRWEKTMNRPIAFVADQQALRAIAPLSASTALGGLRVIELVAEDDPGKPGTRRLVLRQVPVRYDAEKFDEDLDRAERHVVLDGLSEAAFAYFGATEPGGESSWQDAWTNPEQLPRLIRLHLAGDVPGGADLMIAPMVGATGSCQWNPLTRQCK